MKIKSGTKTTVLASIVSVFAVVPCVTSAQMNCPPEVEAAKNNLKARQAAQSQTPRQLAGARQDVQAPRAQDVQAPRGQDVQAPRGQDVQAPREEVQAPRGQDVQAPRGQDVQAPREDVQAPRGQDVQAPRGQDVQAPRAPAGGQAQRDEQAAASPSSGTPLERVEQLVADAEAACARNDMAGASSSAKMALELMKSLE